MSAIGGQVRHALKAEEIYIYMLICTVATVLLLALLSAYLLINMYRSVESNTGPSGGLITSPIQTSCDENGHHGLGASRQETAESFEFDDCTVLLENLPFDHCGTYVISDQLSAGCRGELITSIDQGSDSRLGAARRITLLYHSKNLRGEDVAVSGVLLIPPGIVPIGGWPLMSWAHGTVGIADCCAPSHKPNMGANIWAAYLRALLNRGFAVAATDYIGLGTPGEHAYMCALDQGNAVADIVPAAHQLNPNLSSAWCAVGHSQGGAAVLSATRSGPDGRLPEGLFATIAVAPGNSVDSVPRAVLDGTDSDPVSPLLNILVLAGAAAANPAIKPELVLSAEGKKVLQVVREGVCLHKLLQGPISEESFFVNNQLAISTLEPQLRAYGNPDNTPTNGPVLIVTGDRDTVVPTSGTISLIDRLLNYGCCIESLVRPGGDHFEPLLGSLDQQLAFLTKYLRSGRSVRGTALI